jgi:AMMECR1 domain-containing protein
VEKKYPYSRVEWSTRSNGMPLYTLLDENYKKIETLTNLCHKAKQKSETMKLSASMRFNVAKYEEEEKEYTKEEIACMAL